MSDKITLDAAVLRDTAKRLNDVGLDLVEAMNSLNRANRHTGWRCPERNTVNNKLSDIDRNLHTAARAVAGLANALNSGASRYEAWENTASQRESEMNAQLTKNWSFLAKVWSGAQGIASRIGGAFSSINLPTISLPKPAGLPHVNLTETFSSLDPLPGLSTGQTNSVRNFVASVTGQK